MANIDDAKNKCPYCRGTGMQSEFLCKLGAVVSDIFCVLAIMFILAWWLA